MSGQTTYIARLQSFKDGKLGGKKVKWNTKGPSMASLARAFLKFCPTRQHRDLVRCTECDIELYGWSGFKGNPLLKHAGLNLSCIVAQVATLFQLFKNENLFEAEQFVKALERTFASADFEPSVARLLARSGFLCMPHNDNERDTVGCVGCLCFPQKGTESPKHTTNCPIQAAIRSSHLERRTSVCSSTPSAPVIGDQCGDCGSVEKIADSKATETSAILVRSSLEASMPLGKLPNVRSVSEPCDLRRGNRHSPMSFSELQNSISTQALEQAVVKLESVRTSEPPRSEDRCVNKFEMARSEMNDAVLKSSAGLESGELSSLESLEMLEHNVVTVLRMAHAHRISIICEESERLASKLIKEASIITARAPSDTKTCT